MILLVLIKQLKLQKSNGRLFFKINSGIPIKKVDICKFLLTISLSLDADECLSKNLQESDKDVQGIPLRWLDVKEKTITWSMD